MDGAPGEPLSIESALVAENLERWPQTAGGVATLISVSENHMFRVDRDGGAPHILRLHRPGYQSRSAIASELGWIGALRRDTDLPVPRPLAARDGALLQEVAPGRFAVLFAFEPGVEPSPASDLVPLFETLGRYAATAHRHVLGWKQPAGFIRQVWSADAILDSDGLWGDWRRAAQVEGAVRETLDRLDARLRSELAAYGRGHPRFGLIHGDMRLGNLLVDGDKVTLIDFDDSGFCWFLYDLAASLSFNETLPQVPQLVRSWLTGYMAIRHLSPDDLRMIDPMILLRRMALLAWIGSHGDTELARTHADRFAEDTAMLAQRYLG